MLFLETTTILSVCRKGAPHFNTQKSKETCTWGSKVINCHYSLSRACSSETAFFKNCIMCCDEEWLLIWFWCAKASIVLCVCGFSFSGHEACRILVPWSLQWKCRVLTTGPPENSQGFDSFIHCWFWPLHHQYQCHYRINKKGKKIN